MFVEKTLDGMWGIKDLFLIFEKSHISKSSEPSNVSSIFAASLLFLVLLSQVTALFLRITSLWVFKR